MANASASAVTLYVYARFPAIFSPPRIDLAVFDVERQPPPKTKTPPKHGKAHQRRVCCIWVAFCFSVWAFGAAVFRRLGPIVCVAACRALVEPSCDFSKNIITFQAILRQDPPFSIIIFSKKAQVNV
jgi:hypothetical protein